MADHALHELDVGRREGGTRQRLDFAGGKDTAGFARRAGLHHGRRRTAGRAAARGEERERDADDERGSCWGDQPVKNTPREASRGSSAHVTRGSMRAAAQLLGGEMKAAFFRKRRELQHHRREVRRRFEQLEVDRADGSVSGSKVAWQDRGA